MLREGWTMLLSRAEIAGLVELVKLHESLINFNLFFCFNVSNSQSVFAS